MLNLTTTVDSFSKSNNPQDLAATPVIRVNNITVWFSFLTVIAFQVGTNPRIVRQSGGSGVLAKHLKELDGGGKEARKGRVPAKRFNQLYKKQLDAVVAETVRRAA